jgi:hypothetical protein
MERILYKELINKGQIQIGEKKREGKKERDQVIAYCTKYRLFKLKKDIRPTAQGNRTYQVPTYLLRRHLHSASIARVGELVAGPRGNQSNKDELSPTKFYSTEYAQMALNRWIPTKKTPMGGKKKRKKKKKGKGDRASTTVLFPPSFFLSA